jgi:hypothetical protein
MPDVWTTNPVKLKNYLEESGSVCGIAPRVIKNRDPYWTCTYDSKGWLRDVYIHNYQEFYQDRLFTGPLIIFFITGIFIGLLWGRTYWRNEKDGRTSAGRTAVPH